jgi:hypothetical protein
MRPQFSTGDRVQTKYGDGTVVSKRMAAPDYSEAAAYSVCLDHCADRAGYSGTIVAPCDLQAFESSDC